MGLTRTGGIYRVITPNEREQPKKSPTVAMVGRHFITYMSWIRIHVKRLLVLIIVCCRIITIESSTTATTTFNDQRICAYLCKLFSVVFGVSSRTTANIFSHRNRCTLTFMQERAREREGEEPSFYWFHSRNNTNVIYFVAHNAPLIFVRINCAQNVMRCATMVVCLEKNYEIEMKKIVKERPIEQRKEKTESFHWTHVELGPQWLGDDFVRLESFTIYSFNNNDRRRGLRTMAHVNNGHLLPSSMRCCRFSNVMQ